MKIGFDVAQTCVDKAGCGWYADSLIRALASVAPEHHFFLYHQFGDWINHSTEHGTQIDALNVTPTFTDITAKEAIRIWQNPDELLIKTGAPDIVHANSFRAPRIPGAKIVFTVYDVSFWAVPHFTTEKNRLVCQTGVLQALGNADGFIFISQSAHNEFERMLPGWLASSGRPFAVTPLGPKTFVPTTKAIPSDVKTAVETRYWLTVGSFEPRKNYTTLLDALELYWASSTRHFRLRIAGGSGWKSSDLHERIRKLTSRGMVEHLGYVPNEQLPSLYSEAEAFIFPSWYEGFGLPVIEAMSFGCPVISSDRTSLKEVAGDAAIYVDPADPVQIADAMLAIETGRIPTGKMAALSLRQAAKFSWQRTAKQTLEFYNRLLNQSPPA